MPETPFDSVESAQHYIMLLIEETGEDRKEIETDIKEAAGRDLTRQLEALRLVDHKLHQLGVHLHATSRILNDLRMLRRLLLGQTEDG